MKPAYILFLSAALFSCSGHEGYDSSATVPVAPVYSIVCDSSSIATPETEAFLRTVGAESLGEWSKSRAVAVFTPDVDSVFADAIPTGTIVGNILKRADAQGLSFPARSYAAVVYGRPESIMFVDSTMLIALNHYLGAEYPGYSHLPYYIREGKTPERMPYDIAEALTATSYPFIGTDNPTLLSRLLYQGALTEAKLRLVPGASKAEALGYTDEEYKYLEENERGIWQSIVASRLLYDTSPATADRLLAPAPAVTITTPSAPGRAGRYIGYKIVASYLTNHPGTDLTQLLDSTFYNSTQTLAESGY